MNDRLRRGVLVARVDGFPHFPTDADVSMVSRPKYFNQQFCRNLYSLYTTDLVKDLHDGTTLLNLLHLLLG